MPEPYASASKLAVAVGKSKTAVAKWLKREDWPFGNGPWTDEQLPAIQAWAASTLREDRSVRDNAAASQPAGNIGQQVRDLGPMSQAKLKLLIARIRKLEAEHSTFTREYVKRSDVEAENVRKVLAVKAELMNSARLLGLLEPCLLANERDNADAIIRNWAKGICDRFAGEKEDADH